MFLLPALLWTCALLPAAPLPPVTPPPRAYRDVPAHTKAHVLRVHVLNRREGKRTARTLDSEALLSAIYKIQLPNKTTTHKSSMVEG